MAIDLAYRIVDVFSDRPLAGNALCVVLDPCPEAVMAAIAREVNLSETTFPVVTGEDSYEMRIFTPFEELPFAGHPSLGTAWVLGPNRWHQTTDGASVVVEADGQGAVMSQPDPEFQEVDASPFVQALGLAGAEGAYLSSVAGLRNVIVPTNAAIDSLDPVPARITAAARAVGAPSVCPVRRIDDATLHVRAFFPGVGVSEDPGTGSAAGPIGVLAQRLWGTAIDVTIFQGAEIGRPCRLEVHAALGDVRVGGRVAACAEGSFTL